jgi:serine-rich repeat adhesion-like glycoprotein
MSNETLTSARDRLSPRYTRVEAVSSPELADVYVEADSDDLSRGEVILKGALAVGAVYGAAMVGPFVGRALAMSEGGDVGILNFALTLEYLESTFYREAKTRAKASGDLKSLIELVGRDEDEHVGALTETIKKLGGKPVAEPKFDFPYNDTAGFLKLAQTFEDTGVSAYNGAAPQIKSKEVLEAAGSIVQVEARHAAAIRLQNGDEPSPVAFDPALPEAKVLKAVEPFIA